MPIVPISPLPRYTGQDTQMQMWASQLCGAIERWSTQLTAPSIDAGITNPARNAAAGGTTQGTATQLVFAPMYVTSGTGGVVLPQATDFAGGELPVYNRTGATITVYPFPGDTIEGHAVNVGVPILVWSVGRFSVDETGLIRMA